MRVQTIFGRNRRKFRMVICPCVLAARFVFMAGSIGLLKPGRCLPPWYKSYSLNVGATVQSDKDSANNQTFHADSWE
jgi:hypothetical protein